MRENQGKLRGKVFQDSQTIRLSAPPAYLFFLQVARTLGLQNYVPNAGLQSHLQTKSQPAKSNPGLQKTPQKIVLGVESEALGVESEALL